MCYSGLCYEAIVSTDFWLESDENDANLEKQRLLNYFEKNYIGVLGRTQGQGRRKPRFPITLWNVFDLTVLGKILNLFCHEHIF